jgi:ATP/ADP translocase
VHYLIYTWKDIYVVLLVEIFYSYANTVFPIQTARWVYGLFGLLASLGSAAGALAVGWLADELGTANALLSVVPLLLLLWLSCLPLSKVAGAVRPTESSGSRPGLREATRVVRGSAYLSLLLGLVALVQVVVTLIDFQYFAVLENSHPEMDQRTGVSGRVYSGVAGFTIVLHALTGPVLRLTGVPAVLGAVPTLLAGATTAFALARGFVTAVVIKISSKVLDYTIFRVAKEILYIPLSFSEKTMGKSVIDMVIYREAKALASLLLIGLGAAQAFSLVTPMTLLLIGGWFGVSFVIIRRFRRRVSRAEEMRPLHR